MQEILNKYGIKVDYQTILTCWNESHRHYYNTEHLYNLLEEVGIVSTPGTSEYEKLFIGVLFDHIVYQPTSTTNKEDSVVKLLEWSDSDNSDINEIKSLILEENSSPLQEKFNQIQNKLITTGSLEDLVKWEEGVAKEYIPVVGEELYKEGRKKYLLDMCDKYPTRSNLFDQIIEKYL